ncbi:hypothetical protein M758_1G284700 [Ceratodon purpureus]|uniref:Uncharacterized protein n=1 Tax=Ceratodon purpureus TaxID=3225 RepID=A0A8T0JCB3_CERPU|nr:hypothetical protein KC19_1G293200 [Ceratodon purpureus]KAG0631860.1 hypothetical protein M758_1G284700 [Ceratodon purpureus]
MLREAVEMVTISISFVDVSCRDCPVFYGISWRCKPSALYITTLFFNVDCRWAICKHDHVICRMVSASFFV